MTRKSVLQALTANDLIEGDVIYLGHENTWTVDIAEAAIAEDAGAAAGLAAAGAGAVAAQLVVEPYLIEVVRDGETVVPVHYREKLRALGPSTRPDLGKQADPARRAV